MVLKLQNKQKEHEKWKRMQEEKFEELEEELRVVGKDGKVAQAHIVELVQSSVSKFFSFALLPSSDQVLI